MRWMESDTPASSMACCLDEAEFVWRCLLNMQVAQRMHCRPQFVQNSPEHAGRQNSMPRRITNCESLPIIRTARYQRIIAHASGSGATSRLPIQKAQKSQTPL